MKDKCLYHHNVINAHTIEGDSPAIIIELHQPTDYDIIKKGRYHAISMQIAAEQFDELALRWCKKRGLLSTQLSTLSPT